LDSRTKLNEIIHISTLAAPRTALPKAMSYYIILVFYQVPSCLTHGASGVFHGTFSRSENTDGVTPTPPPFGLNSCRNKDKNSNNNTSNNTNMNSSNNTDIIIIFNNNNNNNTDNQNVDNNNNNNNNNNSNNNNIIIKIIITIIIIIIIIIITTVTRITFIRTHPTGVANIPTRINLR
jgi:ATP-dependent Zn protease